MISQTILYLLAKLHSKSSAILVRLSKRSSIYIGTNYNEIYTINISIHPIIIYNIKMIDTGSSFPFSTLNTAPTQPLTIEECLNSVIYSRRVTGHLSAGYNARIDRRSTDAVVADLISDRMWVCIGELLDWNVCWRGE